MHIYEAYKFVSINTGILKMSKLAHDEIITVLPQFLQVYMKRLRFANGIIC